MFWYQNNGECFKSLLDSYCYYEFPEIDIYLWISLEWKRKRTAASKASVTAISKCTLSSTLLEKANFCPKIQFGKNFTFRNTWIFAPNWKIFWNNLLKKISNIWIFMLKTCTQKKILLREFMDQNDCLSQCVYYTRKFFIPSFWLSLWSHFLRVLQKQKFEELICRSIVEVVRCYLKYALALLCSREVEMVCLMHRRPLGL